MSEPGGRVPAVGLALFISFVAVQINRKQQAVNPMGVIGEMIDFTVLLVFLEAAIVSGPAAFPLCSPNLKMIEQNLFYVNLPSVARTTIPPSAVTERTALSPVQ